MRQPTRLMAMQAWVVPHWTRTLAATADNDDTVNINLRFIVFRFMSGGCFRKF